MIVDISKSAKWIRDMLEKRAINPDTGCWIWTGYVHETGYGVHCGYKVHRIAVMEWGDKYGNDVEDGIGSQVHHLCGEKLCFYPPHLQVMTPKEHAEVHGELRSKYFA